MNSLSQTEAPRYREITIDILRHGECEDGHCYRGKTDVALSDRGHEQMLSSIKNIETQWSYLVSSPLQRCALFAEKLSVHYDIPLHLERRIEELHFGDWEGNDIDVVWETQQTAVKNWFSDPVAFPPPNGERADTFATRVVNAIHELTDTLPLRHSHILLVTHGGVIRALLAHCLSMPLQKMGQLDVPYACISRIKINHDRQASTFYYQVVAHNVKGIL
ncbi:histidine phosphatase family protein [Eionea flava]